MLPVEIAARSLQPYPDIPNQKVVSVVSTISTGYDKLVAIVAFPFTLIGKAYEGVRQLKCNYRVDQLMPRPRLPGDVATSTYAKTSTMSYDNKFNYMIHDGKAWFRPLGLAKEAKWKELGNGNPSDQPLVSCSADGDNLIVVDVQHRLWYVKTYNIDVMVYSDCPKWRVVKEELAWIRSFYTFPIVSLITNKFSDSGVNVDNLRNIFVTHKGEETLYYTDMSGKKIPDPCGTSMVHAESMDGTEHFLWDPYMNQKRMQIIGPENGQFVSDNSTGSGNMKMLIQRGRLADGTPFNHCYTRFIEVDSLITAYPHTYDYNNRTPMVRFFPPEPWIKQPSIPMRDKTRLTNRIGAMQTGQGQNNRVLFWEGTLPDGHTTGFYCKFVYDPTWNFKPTNHVINADDFLCQEGIRRGPRIAFDYNCDFQSEVIKSIYLRQFISLNKTERAPNTTIEIMLPNNLHYTLRLHQLKGLKYVFGLSDTDDHWTLIAPREVAADPAVQGVHRWIMEGAASIPLTVEESEGHVRISYSGRFEFNFTKSNEEDEIIGLMSSQLVGDL